MLGVTLTLARLRLPAQRDIRDVLVSCLQSVSNPPDRRDSEQDLAGAVFTSQFRVLAGLRETRR